MKIIHMADIHLGSSFTTHYSKAVSNQKRAELFNLFSHVIEEANKQLIYTILISGDLFDQDTVNNNLKNNVLSLFKSHPEIDFYYLRGNHDQNSVICDLDNVHFYTNERFTYYPIPETSITISGIELSDYNQGTIGSLLSLNQNDFNIVMLHGEVVNTTSLKKDQINGNTLKNKGIDYLALGHIHKQGSGKIDERGVYYYPGCLVGRGFDEVGKHGYMLLDIDETKHQCSSQFIEIPEGEVYLANIDISDCTSQYDIKKRIIQLLEGKYNTNALISIILTGNIGMDLDVDLPTISKLVEGQYPYIHLEDQVSYNIDYSSYIGEATLKGEFVDLILKSSETKEDQEYIIRLGLKALEGD